MKTFTLVNQKVGPKAPCYIIAEIGANHNQNEDTARRLIDACVEAGVDAVKFQSFTVENWISKDFTEFPTIKDSNNLHFTLRKAEMPYDMYASLNAYCLENSVTCFSTPSHRTDVDALDSLHAPAFKFGAVQITDLPTIQYAARLGKPIILSAGASDLSEVAKAVETIWDAGNDQIALLQCTSMYPCKNYSLVNLNVMKCFMAMYDFPIGFSDHTLDPVLLPVAATAMGAAIIEKHVTLDRTMPGPDHSFSLEPSELKKMVESVRNVELALGTKHKRILTEEKELARLCRRSLVATRSIPAGEVIGADDLTIKRPGTGIEPRWIDVVVGRKARLPIEADRIITWEMV